MRAMAVWKAGRPPSLLAFVLRPPPRAPVAALLRLGHRSLCAAAGDADGPELTFATSRPLGLKYAQTRDGLAVLKKFGPESQAAGMGIDQGAVVQNTVVLEPGSVVPAGALITSGGRWAGNPASLVAPLPEEAFK